MNPIQIIADMIEANLQTAWEHLQNGDIPLARHELTSAIERLSQIEQLETPPARAQLTLDVESTTLQSPVASHQLARPPNPANDKTRPS